MEYDIFISYRREGGYDTAKHLNDLLVRDGYKVSFDIDTLRNGNFDTQLLERIDQCKDFILIVDQHAFDRTLDPKFPSKNDWLRNELAYALRKNKNIIPIFLAGVKGFPSGLPSDICGVVKKNGPEYNRYYFNDFYKTLKERFLHKKSGVNYKLIGIIAAIVLLSFIFYVWQRNSATITPSGNTPTQNVSGQNSRDDQLANFCGNFTYSCGAANIGGINMAYELVLDPVNSSCNLQEDGFVNITNSKGYCGTMMQMPEYWEVISFSLNNNGNKAIVEMIGGNNSICNVSLSLDEYNNINMTYISGNEAPSILLDENGEYTQTANFVRD